MTGFDLWLEEKVHFLLRSGQPAHTQLREKELAEERSTLQVRCAARWPLCPWPRL